MVMTKRDGDVRCFKCSRDDNVVLAHMRKKNGSMSDEWYCQDCEFEEGN